MAISPSDPRFVLKTTPPRAAKGLLSRQRLSSNSPMLADKSIIAVNAVSGFGKTSLLAQWRREALEVGSVVAWLTLDARDDDARFTQGLSVALQMGTGQSRPVFIPNDNDEKHEGITGWLAEVVGMSGDIVLFLDDVHLLPDSCTRTSLRYLLHNAPANLKIILASRKPLDFPLSDLIAHGRYASLDTKALRLRLPETMDILNVRFGSRIDANNGGKLHELVEGWPLGLQLAISTIEKAPNLRDAISSCFTLSGDIRHYFVESLVDRLPAELAHFLVSVSFLDALHPVLCRAVTGRDDAPHLLVRLCELTPIVTEGVGSEWLRIHSLAREFLAERFAALPEDEQRRLRERAMVWLAEQQMYEEAGRHALRAGLKEKAYELAERCLYDVLVTGNVSRVAEWMEHIPHQEVLRRPALRLALGWLLAHSERHGEAAELVGPIIDDNSVDEGIRCESAEICAAAALFADDIDEMNRILAPWVGTLPTRSPIQRRIGTNLLAIVKIFQGAPESARYYNQQFQSDDHSGGPFVRGCSDWIFGMSYFVEGQVVLAEEHLRAALSAAEEMAGRRSPMAAMLSATLAATLWERNAQSEIPALLANRIDVIERHTAPSAIIMGLVTAARIAVQNGQEKRAYDFLNTLFALGEARQLPRLGVVSLCEQIRMHALRGHKEICAGLASRLSRLLTSLDSEQWGVRLPLVQLHAGLGLVYAAVVRHDWDEVLDRLDLLAPIAEGLRRGRDRIQIQLLRALALKGRGNDGEALLSEVLSMAEALGLERVLEDTHPNLVDWSRQIRTKRVPDALRQTRELRASGADHSARQAAALSAPSPRVAPSALLTIKEREILQLLTGNLSNKQIASALGIGIETTKWHLKNIYGKLSAVNRKHVLDRARMLGILEMSA